MSVRQRVCSISCRRCLAQESTALLIDFRELTVSPVNFDPSSSGVELLLIDSRERHGHVGGEYAARRLSCERAAADVGVVSLREIQDRGVAVLDGVKDPVDARRARHVLTENQRVFDVVAALGDSDYASVGQIFTASHASMRDDFAITTRTHRPDRRDRGRGGCSGRPDDRRRIRRLRDRVGPGRSSGGRWRRRALSGGRRRLRGADDLSDVRRRWRIRHLSHVRVGVARCAHLRAKTASRAATNFAQRRAQRHMVSHVAGVNRIALSPSCSTASAN